MSRICSACRSKKIRCDGAVPTCRACTKTRKPVECNYTAIAAPRVTKRDLLQKGAACNACRQKKKKCDAKRPCSTCVASNKEVDCHYKDDSPLSNQGISSKMTHGARKLAPAEPSEAPGYSGDILSIAYSSTSELEVLSDANFQLALSSPGLSPMASSDSMSTFDFSAVFDFGNNMSDFSSPSHFASPLTESSDTSSCHSFISPQSMIPDTADDNDLSAPYLLSYAPASETMLLFRTIFLAHRTQLGLYMPEPKLDSLRRGDMSGLIIDPVLVHIVQLWGCFLCHCSDSEESIQLKAALDILNNDNTQLINDPTTSIQAQSLLALYFLAKGDMYRGREHLLKANNVVMKYNLHIVDPTMMVSSLDDDFGGECLWMRDGAELQDEQLAALCQLIYLDKCADLVLRFPTLFAGDMNQELQMLSSAKVAAFSASFIIQRTRSVSYLQQAKNLASQWNPDPSDMATGSSYNKYWDLMRKIHMHQADVKPAMLEASLSYDRELNIAFKLCHILTLTALAHLHDVLATNHSESRRSCHTTVLEIVHATDSIADDDYPLMDPVITICWIFAADVLQRDCHSLRFQTAESGVASMLAVLRNSAQKLKRVVPYVSDIQLL